MMLWMVRHTYQYCYEMLLCDIAVRPSPAGYQYVATFYAFTEQSGLYLGETLHWLLLHHLLKPSLRIVLDNQAHVAVIPLSQRVRYRNGYRLHFHVAGNLVQRHLCQNDLSLLDQSRVADRGELDVFKQGTDRAAHLRFIKAAHVWWWLLTAFVVGWWMRAVANSRTTP